MLRCHLVTEYSCRPLNWQTGKEICLKILILTTIWKELLPERYARDAGTPLTLILWEPPGTSRYTGTAHERLRLSAGETTSSCTCDSIPFTHREMRSCSVNRVLTEMPGWRRACRAMKCAAQTAYAFTWLTLRSTSSLIPATCLLPLAGLAVSTRSRAAGQLGS